MSKKKIKKKKDVEFIAVVSDKKNSRESVLFIGKYTANNEKNIYKIQNSSFEK